MVGLRAKHVAMGHTALLMNDWVVGLAISILAALSSSSSMLLLKASSDREKNRPLWRKPIWFGGFALLLLNGLMLDPAAVSLAPMALIAPMSGLNLIFSLLLARCIMHELVGRAGLLSIAVIFTGMMIVSYCGPHLHRVPTMAELYSRGIPWEAWVMGFAAVAVVVSDLLLIHVPALQRYRPPANSFGGCLYAALAARSCGVFVQCGLKLVATAVRSCIDEGSLNPIWTTMPLFPIALFCFIGLAPLQLYLLNATLGAAPASYAIPVYLSLGTVIATTLSGAIFREFEHHPARKTIGFAIGILVTVSGVALLSYMQGKKEKLEKKEIQPLVDQAGGALPEPVSADAEDALAPAPAR